MRTNIDIDDELMRSAMELGGSKTKREAIDKALREFVQYRQAQRRVMELRGKVEWDGDLDELRRDR